MQRYLETLPSLALESLTLPSCFAANTGLPRDTSFGMVTSGAPAAVPRGQPLAQAPVQPEIDPFAYSVLVEFQADA